MEYLDKIMWGYPVKEHLPYLKDNTWDKFVKQNEKPYPKNSSEETKQELSELIICQHTYNISNKELKNKYIKYDIESPVLFFQNFVKKNLNRNLDKILNDITEDTKTIALHLKYLYQRPRPNQLAIYRNFKLFPQQSCSAISPSYPSGHAFQGMALSLFLTKIFPSQKDFFLKLANDLAKSRMFLGLHFKSDNQYGFELAEKLMYNDLFKIKYLTK